MVFAKIDKKTTKNKKKNVRANYMTIYIDMNPNNINVEIQNKRKKIKKQMSENLQSLENNEQLLAENEQKQSHIQWSRNYDGLTTKTKVSNFIYLLCELDLEYCHIKNNKN